MVEVLRAVHLHGVRCTAEHLELSRQATNPFSRGRVPPTTRSIATQRHQVGNSIHVNVIGAFSSVCLFKFPMVGRSDETQAQSPGVGGTMKRKYSLLLAADSDFQIGDHPENSAFDSSSFRRAFHAAQQTASL